MKSELDAMCESCTQHCPEGFCKAYRETRYEALGVRRVDGWRLEGWYNGRWISISEGAKIAGCAVSTIYHRLDRGMIFAEAVEAGQRRKGRHRDIASGGKVNCIMDWAREYQVNYWTLYNHIVRHGLTLDEALSRIKKREVEM